MDTGFPPSRSPLRRAKEGRIRSCARGNDEVIFYEPDKRDTRLLPHDPFKAIVAPRCIGWITSISAQGDINLAPYSYFNGINSRPNIVMFASEGPKDSVSFIEQTKEF